MLTRKHVFGLAVAAAGALLLVAVLANVDQPNPPVVTPEAAWTSRQYIRLLQTTPVVSKVQCNTGVDVRHRSCELHNVCYDQVTTQWKVFSGGDVEVQPCSVWHAASVIRMEDVHSSLPLDQVAHWVHTPTALLHRHVPENYAHSMQDDLYALYWLMRRHGLPWKESQIALLDGTSADGMHDSFERLRTFYSAFTRHPAIYIPDWLATDKKKRLLCFARVVVGVPFQTMQRNEGMWGVSQRSDPAILDQDRFVSTQLQFIDFLRHSVGLAPRVRVQPRVILLHNRVGRRSFLRVDELETAIRKLVLPMDWHVRTISFDGMPLEDQVRVVEQASILVSMHGASELNSIFMPLGSVLVEVVPASHPFAMMDPPRNLSDQSVGDFFLHTSRNAGNRYVAIQAQMSDYHLSNDPLQPACREEDKCDTFNGSPEVNVRKLEHALRVAIGWTS